MAKYFISWEADMSRFPTDPKERAGMIGGMAGMIKQMIKEGKTSDWGMFLDGISGYSVRQGDAVGLYNDLQKFSPYISFQVQEVLSVDTLIDMAKSAI